MCTSFAPNRTAAFAASIAVFPAPPPRPATALSSASRFVPGNQIERVGHALQFFARDAKLMDRSQSHPQEHGIVIAFQFRERLWSTIVSK